MIDVCMRVIGGLLLTSLHVSYFKILAVVDINILYVHKQALFCPMKVFCFYKKYVVWNVYLPNVVRCIPYTVIEIFEYNCNDLELGRFKVIQGQR